MKSIPELEEELSIANHDDIRKKAERNIKIISLILVMILGFSMYNQFNYFLYLLLNTFDSEASAFVLLLSLIVLGVSVFLFWRKVRIAWVIIAIWLSYSTINALIGLSFSIINASNIIIHFAGLELLTKDFYFSAIIIYGGLLFSIHRQAIQDIFRINKKLQIVSYSIAVVIVVLLMFPIFIL